MDRSKLIEILIKYKIEPKMINMIVELYKEDITKVKMGGREEWIEINSGIKQGCTASTAFFKMVTYEIIKKMEREGDMLEIDENNINSLFFADDSILIAREVESALKNLKIIKEIGKELGLEINEDKSKVMIYKKGMKYRDKVKNIKEIGGIEIVESMRYLGIEICGGEDIFKKQKVEMKRKAENLSRMTYSIIEKSSNKVLMGKTFWKGVAVPSFMLGVGVMRFTLEEIEELQKIENTVYRKILGGRRTSPKVTLRGEIGASRVETRIIKSKLTLIKSIMEGKNELIKEILGNMIRNNKSKWKKKLEIQMNKVNITYRNIEEKGKKEIKKKITEWDTEEWRKELEEKSTLEIYKRNKERIGDEGIYDNRRSSRLLYEARANILDLNDRRRHEKEIEKRITTCTLCGGEYEDINHFMLKCEELEDQRDKELINRKKGSEEDETIGNLLFVFEGNDLEEVKGMLLKLWDRRIKILKIKEKGGRGKQGGEREKEKRKRNKKSCKGWTVNLDTESVSKTPTSGS